MMQSAQARRILAAFDAGATPAQIVHSGVSKRVVYVVLRRERPDRARAPRSRTSLIPAKVRALHAAGVKVGRISALLGITRVYVYRILANARPT